MEYCLRLLIELDAFLAIRGSARFVKHGLHLIAAVKRNVPRGFLGGGFAQEIVEEIVRIPEVSEPS